MGSRSPVEHRNAVGILLRTLRLESGMTQAELAAKLDRAQSYVSKFESRELGLDVLELREVCLAIGTTLDDFVARLEKELKTIGPGTRPQRL